MSRKWVRWTLALLLIATPIGIYETYSWISMMPQTVSIATGTPGGRFHELGTRLAKKLEQELKIKVRVLPTSGSLENLRLVHEGQADFGLYQSGAREGVSWVPIGARDTLRSNILENDPAEVTFMANLYSECVFFLVRSNSDIQSPHDLPGHVVSLGEKRSGDRITGHLLLDHFGIDRSSFDVQELNYRELMKSFREGTLDAAFVSVGPLAPMLVDLLKDGTCRLLDIPHAKALARKHPFFTVGKVPSGLYASLPKAAPAKDVTTVTVRAQWITRDATHTGLVEEALNLLLDSTFLLDNHLGELLDGGKSFARSKPDFPFHLGATHIYEPGIRPMLNSDFVEATEGMRSFLFSTLIASYLAFRWVKRRRELKQEHRLDRYIHALLDIESQQVGIDANLRPEEAATLEHLLDRVTYLRQEALGEFTAHDLNDDRGPECFITMCHALSEKINHKLLRHHVDQLCSVVEVREGVNRDPAQGQPPDRPQSD